MLVLLATGIFDHCKSAHDVMKAGIDLYCSTGTAKEAKLKGHRLHTVRSLEQFVIGDYSWLVIPFDIEHDADEPLGFLIASGAEKLLYVTDSQYIKYHFKGINYLMAETNYSLDLIRESVKAEVIDTELKNRVMKSHLSLETFCEFLKVNDISALREVWLLHLSDGNSNAEEFKKTIQAITGKPCYIA